MAETYVTTSEVDTYASERLNSRAWETASTTNRNKAIIQATRIMERLNYSDEKTEEDQELEFPRGSDVTIPQAIKDACCEIVIALLGGADVERKADQQKVTSRRYASVGTSYDPRIVSEHAAAGVPSYEAWLLLRPYLADPSSVVISRIS